MHMLLMCSLNYRRPVHQSLALAAHWCCDIPASWPSEPVPDGISFEDSHVDFVNIT
jgi:hypothetical protein